MTNTNTQMAEALAGSYLLVDVGIRRFSGMKKDKAASIEVTNTHGASSNAAKVTKDLLAGARVELKEVAATQDAIRSYLYSKTLPWASNSEGRKTGARLLAAGLSLEFLKNFKVLHTAYELAKADFLNVYDSRRGQAMQNLGTLADPDDYPTKDEIAYSFAVDLDMSPVPAPTDFSRLSVPAQLSESLGNIIAKKQTMAMENAMKDLSDRIVAELKRMATALGKHGAGEKTRLYASLLGNMDGLIDLLKSSNFTNDDKMNDLVDRLRDCTKHDIDTLKANPTMAASVAEAAVAITTDIEDDLFF